MTTIEVGLLAFLVIWVLWDAHQFFFPEWHAKRLYDHTVQDTKWNKVSK